VVVGKKVARSPSIYPDDPESAHYDPNCYAQEAEAGHQAAPRSPERVAEPEPVAALLPVPRREDAKANALALQRIFSIPPGDPSDSLPDAGSVPAPAVDVAGDGGQEVGSAPDAGSVPAPRLDAPLEEARPIQQDG
jgi:hypothetical protein